MAEYKKIEGREKFDYSRMGKQTHRDFLKVKPKIQAKQSGGCMDPSALSITTTDSTIAIRCS